MRLIVAGETPTAAAMCWPVQRWRRRASMVTTVAAGVGRCRGWGREERSCRPVTPSVWKRATHLRTVLTVTPKAAATAVGVCPSTTTRRTRSARLCGADSRGRRNSCVRRSQQLVKGLGRCSPPERLTRPAVQRRGHSGKSFRAVHAQVSALGEVLPQQPVGVLVRAALPGAVGIAEVDLHASIDPQLRVLAQLRSLIPGQRASQLFGQGGDRARDGVAHRLSPMPGERGPVLGAHAAAMARHAGQVKQDGEPRRALHQRANRRAAQPHDEVPLPVARHGPIGRLGRTLADQDLGRDAGPAPFAAARPRHPQGPPGAQAGGQLAAQRPAALHVQGLVDSLVADPHGLIVGEVEPQAAGDLLRAPRPGPPAGVPTPPPAALSRPHPPPPPPPPPAPPPPPPPPPHPPPPPPGPRPRRPASPARPPAAPRSQPASPASGDGPPARHATARSWPDTPDRRCAWRRCAAAHARSWTPHAPAVGRSPAPHSPAPATAQVPRVPQTTDTAPMAASLMGQISSVTCRPPPGTSGPPPRVTHRPRSPPPRLTDPPQSPPRTAAGSHAAPRRVGRATAATRLVVPDPSAVSQPSSQPPPSRCCDDHLNPRGSTHSQ